MTTSWSRSEESNFQELIRQAEAQSREYYIRSGAVVAVAVMDKSDSSLETALQYAPVQPPVQHTQQIACLPPPSQQSAPCKPTAPCGNTVAKPTVPSRQTAPKAVAPQCGKGDTRFREHHPSQQTGGIKETVSGLVNGLGLDIETLLLCGLLWLLWEEDADWKVLLALAYILLV